MLLLSTSLGHALGFARAGRTSMFVDASALVLGAPRAADRS